MACWTTFGCSSVDTKRRRSTIAGMAPPQKYDRSKAVPEICARMSGGESFASIRRDLGIPRGTTDKWVAQVPEIKAAFQMARDEGYDAIADRLRETARGKGESTEDVQRDKLIIDTDLKLLAKWDPRRYGDKVQLANHEGGELPSTHLSDDILMRIASAALAPEAKTKASGE